MKADTLVENGWTLAAPGDVDIDDLMGWFPDARSVDIWGGPRFRYPFTRESFSTDSRLGKMLSYCLRDPEGRLVGFGQVYDRHDRGHLARLITHPNMRRQGIGRRLIKMLCKAAQQSRGYNEYSLFVYRDNEPAYRCYLAMGFVLRDYPEDAPMKEDCYFLTRSADLDKVRLT